MRKYARGSRAVTLLLIGFNFTGLESSRGIYAKHLRNSRFDPPLCLEDRPDASRTGDIPGIPTGGVLLPGGQPWPGPGPAGREALGPVRPGPGAPVL